MFFHFDRYDLGRVGVYKFDRKFAIGLGEVVAVVGQIRQVVSGVVTSAGEGRFTVHLAEGPTQFASRDAALDALQAALSDQARDRAQRAGAEHLTLTHTRDIREVEIEGRSMFVEAEVTVTATGRPRIAHG